MPKSSTDLTRALLGLPARREPTDGEIDSTEPAVPTWIVLQRLIYDRRVALLGGIGGIGAAVVGGMPIYDVFSGLPFPLDTATVEDLLVIAVIAGALFGGGVASLGAYFVASRRIAEYRAIAPVSQGESSHLERTEEPD